MKFKPCREGDLCGTWEVSRKIDGVHLVIKDGKATSKRGKPLHNLDIIANTFPEGRYEVFKDDWETSVSMVRTHNGASVPSECVYSLGPLDDRLFLYELVDPTQTEIMVALDIAVARGWEGLVFTQGAVRWKMKPEHTVDVRITGRIEGKGKYKGMLGAFDTPYGKVGSGLSDEDREMYWRINAEWNAMNIDDAIIEVKFMEWTKGGKFRHPRFVRVRWDKDEENLEI